MFTLTLLFSPGVTSLTCANNYVNLTHAHSFLLQGSSSSIGFRVATYYSANILIFKEPVLNQHM